MNLRGPKAKISRRLGVALTQKVQKVLDRRNYAPGQHGPAARSNEPKSVYGKQLREKQRLRAQYNISERQLRNYFVRARSIFAARQYAAHGHFEVNGRRVNRPSIHLRPGDEIRLREPSQTCPTFLDERLLQQLIPEYLEVDRERFCVRLLRQPSAHEIPVLCNLAMVVEFYSR